MFLRHLWYRSQLILIGESHVVVLVLHLHVLTVPLDLRLALFLYLFFVDLFDVPQIENTK